MNTRELSRTKNNEELTTLKSFELLFLMGWEAIDPRRGSLQYAIFLNTKTALFRFFRFLFIIHVKLGSGTILGTVKV
jgi:hypothetical protein